MSNPSWAWISTWFRRAVVALPMLAVTIVLGPATIRAQTFTVLYSFKGTRDGAVPYATLIRDPQGNLYGTTSGGWGSIFRLDPAGKLKVMHQFNGKDGQTPYAGVIRDAKGNLYGTAYTGGDYSYGTVFKLAKSGKLMVLHSFGGGDGAYPRAPLIRDERGNLYGTTQEGGTEGCGTVFKVDSTGKETVLSDLCDFGGDTPFAGLIMDSEGNLYGATALGGPHQGSNCIETGCGTIFRLDRNGRGSQLYAFTDGPDGANPLAGLVRDQKGNLFGTTWNGGDAGCNFGLGCGVVFKLSRNGKETPLYQFTSLGEGEPVAPLVRDAAGNFYGTASGNECGGSCGIVFKVDKTGKETVLHTFTNGMDGAQPNGGLLLDQKGNLYGTASTGGMYGKGTVFKITP
jgi:uncharacterized repeat protein (TIGR03803 family)